MTGVLQGKFPYMSPEQTEGAELTQASDIFSFGSLAYELLTQTRPFEGESDMMILTRVKKAQYRPIREVRPDLPESFAEVVSTCLQKDLTARYSRGSELERALATVMQESGWVVSEGDITKFLAELYGDSRRPEPQGESAPEDEEGEILEASPLDPYDLKAGLPVRPQRPATPPPPQELTRAVAQPDWHRRQRRKTRGWLAWALFMAAAAIFLVLDYTTLHVLLPPHGAAPPMAAEITESPERTETAHEQDSTRALDLDSASDQTLLALADGGDVRTLPDSKDSDQLPPDVPDVTTGIDLPDQAALTLDAASEADFRSPDADIRAATLTPALARSSTRLSVLPEDAIIYLDDRPLGPSPQVLSFVEGGNPREIRIEKDGYVSVSFSLRHPGPRSLGKRLKPLELGRLYLRYTPASASVLIDGKAVVSSHGLNIIDRQLTVGPHTVIVREGEQETTKIITIDKDREWRGTITATP